VQERDVPVIGREQERAALAAFVSGAAAQRALVIAGEPGIGKTTLWEAGIATAREHGLRALVARPSSAEIQLSYVALGDLLYGLEAETLAGLPEPQRHALDVALLRAEPAGAPPEPRAIALALLGALRALASTGPLLVAIDDAQWLDPPSGEALAFAARRLTGAQARFLLARRDGGAAPLEAALGVGQLKRVQLAPLSLGATRLLLQERLGLTLPRRVLRRVVDAAHGNPFFALELGRALAERGVPEIGEELVIPEAVEDVVWARIERLPPAVRRLLLAVELGQDLRPPQLAAIADAGALDAALDAGVLIAERDRLRLSHPLLGAAARARSRAAERRELHVELAGAAGDEERRARHLALAAEGPDAELAAAVAAAAAHAARRGAAEDAVELAEHALRLTPPGAPERPERVLALAQRLETAGAETRIADLLGAELATLPHGPPRARAHVLLADAAVAHVDDQERHIELALAECEGASALRGGALALKSTLWSIVRAQRVPEAEAWALEGADAARGIDPDAERRALAAVAWARSLRALPIADVRERSVAASDAVVPLDRSVDAVAGVRLGWRGEVAAARTQLAALLALADERGEAWSYAALLFHLCEVALRAGDWAEAQRLLEDDEPWDAFQAPVRERCHALLAAGRGDAATAERWAEAAIAGAERTGIAWDGLEARRARGIAALLDQRPESALADLRAVWDATEAAGIEELGAFPVAADLVEALVDVGEDGEALRVAGRLRALAERADHPWARASAQRCLALVAVASDDRAVAELAGAAADYERLGLGFDHARTLLSLGRATRRRRKWGAARDALERAAAAFDELGSPGWAERARGELARVGARRPRAAGELTPTEQRVAELAASGMSNKQIAHALFITVHTVEAHLSHAYAKLGVHSRGQLAGKLSAPA
jgi:DNA-binding CsgD family transcriptional regulator